LLLLLLIPLLHLLLLRLLLGWHHHRHQGDVCGQHCLLRLCVPRRLQQQLFVRL
jgi:hypothetical protein